MLTEIAITGPSLALVGVLSEGFWSGAIGVAGTLLGTSIGAILGPYFQRRFDSAANRERERLDIVREILLTLSELFEINEYDDAVHWQEMMKRLGTQTTNLELIIPEGEREICVLINMAPSCFWPRDSIVERTVAFVSHDLAEGALKRWHLGEYKAEGAVERFFETGRHFRRSILEGTSFPSGNLVTDEQLTGEELKARLDLGVSFPTGSDAAAKAQPLC